MGDPAQVVNISDTGPRTLTQQITGFIDDAADRPSSLPLIRRPEDNAIGSSLESRVHSIVDVLSRPVLLSSDTWADTQIQDDLLFRVDFPQVLFDISSNIEDKLNYFSFLRADICIRVMVNANTFQQGKLLAFFTPFDPLVGNRNVVSDFTSSYTVLPHATVDASVGNSIDLCIPYVSPYSSYRLTDGTGSIGTFFLSVLNPLRSGECTFSVYAWFTNISVDLPSGKENALSASSSILSSIKRAIKSMSISTVKEYLQKTPIFKGQVAGEDEQKSSGIISATAHQISSAADTMTAIPVIGDVAAPVSWVAKAIANVAEYFGYSKSQNLSTPTRYSNIPGYGWTNASGVDSSVVLGCTQDNCIEPRGDLFGSAVDDMDIAYICKHRSYVDKFTFSTNQAPGTELYAYPVTPGWCTFDRATYKPTATAFVASMFNYWRGGLKYKIQAAKTAYHSGRLRIIYLPASSNSSVDDAEQAYNWVLDLRVSSEIEFVIPYNNILEWSESKLSNGVGAAGSIGTVRIEVLNELRAPSSVASDIELNIWIAGESDIQFAIPTIQNYVPSLPDVDEPLDFITPSKDPVLNTIGLLGGIEGLDSEFSRREMARLIREKRELLEDDSARPITNSELDSLESKFHGQVLGNFQDTGFNDMSDRPSLFKMNDNDVIAPCKYSIGEYVSNLRYIIRRFGFDRTITTSSTDSYYELPSYYFSRVFNPAIDDIATYRITPIDYVSWLYRFFRGGIRWKFLANANGLDQGYQEAILVNDFESTRTITSITQAIFNRFLIASATFSHRVYTLLNPVLEVTVPFYSQTPIRPIVGTDTAQPPFLEDNAVMYHSHITGNSGTVDIMKAAHDDFSFGWIVGPPRLRPRDAPFITVATPITTFTEVSEGEWRLASFTTTSTKQDGDYNILAAQPTSFTVAFTDMTDQQVNFAGGRLTKTGTSVNVFVNFTVPDMKTVDTATTLTNINSEGTYEFLISGPL